MNAPDFWQHGGVASVLLAPFGRLYAAVTARRMAGPGWRAPVPVICCGNAVAGGSGKTTLALDLGARLLARGVPLAFLTRGYGGRVRGASPVTVGSTARDVGDEALLLARLAPCFVGADRAATARLAVAAGARALVLDDGLQNPTLQKTLSLLVIDGAAGFGNRRMIPAGPLREPVAAAAGRCQAAVLIGPDRTGALAALPPGLPVLRCDLRSEDAPVGARVFAFAGIGRPEKFFAGLERAGALVVGQRAFADHHVFTDAELRALTADAARLDALLATTPKDAVRLPPWVPARSVGVALVWEAPAEIEALLAGLFT